MDVYEHKEEGVVIGSWLHGSRFRECLEDEFPDAEELESTGCLSDPFFDLRAGLSTSIQQSRSAPVTPAIGGVDAFRWHDKDSSAGSDSKAMSPSSSASSFLPKLVRRLSAKASMQQPLRPSKLKKRGTLSISVDNFGPNSPTNLTLSRSIDSHSPSLPLERARSHNNNPASPILKEKPSRPQNRRSFSAPLFELIKGNQHRSESKSPIGKENIDPRHSPPSARQSFDVISRNRYIPPARTDTRNLSQIAELPSDLTLFARRHLADMQLETGCPVARSRTRTNSTPSVTSIFPVKTPLRESARSRRHSLATPALSPSRNSPDSDRSLLVPSPSPTKSVLSGRRSSYRSSMGVLLPLAASNSSFDFDNSDETECTSISPSSCISSVDYKTHHDPNVVCIVGEMEL